MSDRSLILVITDAGEEIDDETALFYLKNYVGLNNHIDLHILMCNGKLTSEERLIRVRQFIGEETENVKYGLIDDHYMVNELTKNNYFKKYVLQIGPVFDNELYSINKIIENLGEYDYHLLGNLGSSLNSNPSINAYAAAEYLKNNAMKSNIIQTKFNGKTVVPYYTPEIVNWFETPLFEYEILKLGFKNTIGRAPALPFTVHLVGPNGANHESLKYLFHYAANPLIFQEIVPLASTKFLAENYMIEVRSHNAYNGEFMKSQLSLLKQTEESQIDGLARMIEAIHMIFDLPREIYYSSDKRFEKPELHFKESWNRYCVLMHNFNKIQITPAYDLIAAISVVKSIEGEYQSYFEENGVFRCYWDKTLLIQLLQEIK